MPKRSLHQTVDEQLHRLIAQGNHEAYGRLLKRYKFHTFNLCHDVLLQYSNTGVTIKELMTVCDCFFQNIIRKFDATLNSFFSFWKGMTLRRMIEYLIDNSYILEFDSPRMIMSIDEEFEDRHPAVDMICEKDDEISKRVYLFEIKNAFLKNIDSFSKQEGMVLRFVLDGYSLPELEHSGVMSLSTLYLTFKTATEKLQKLIKKLKTNIP